MKTTPRKALPAFVSRRLALTALVMGLPLGVGACNLLESDLNPGEIQVVLESSSGGDMQVVVSSDFVVEGVDENTDLEILFINADTIITGAPFNETYPLEPSFRFFVKVSPTDSTQAPRPLTMTVLVDGNQRYNKTGSLGEEDFEFL